MTGKAPYKFESTPLQQRVSSKLESDTPGKEGQTRTQQCRRRPRKRGHRGPSEKAIAKPTARAANDNSAMTGTGGRGAGLAGGWKLPRSGRRSSKHIRTESRQRGRSPLFQIKWQREKGPFSSAPSDKTGVNSTRFYSRLRPPGWRGRTMLPRRASPSGQPSPWRTWTAS